MQQRTASTSHACAHKCGASQRMRANSRRVALRASKQQDTTAKPASKPAASSSAKVQKATTTIEATSPAAWFAAEAEKPAFLALEIVLGLAFIGLLDGGFSGDWLRYGYVDLPTQIKITYAASAGIALHGIIASIAAQRAMRLRKTPLGNIFAFTRGFFFGTPELLRVLALSRSRNA